MDIQCDSCKTVYKIQDGLIPAGKKVRYTCKRCRPAGGAAPASPATAAAPAPPAPAAAAAPGLPPRERILNGIRELPAMPQVLSEIQTQMAGADINTRKICGLIEADPAIATKVLRSANSAYYGQSGRVATTTGALNLIGLKGLLEVVALAGAQRLLVGRLPGYGYQAEDLWKHSLAVACGSKLLALRQDPGISETAYIAGLIHDVGRIILDRLVLEMKAEIAEFMEREQKTFLDAETRFFGVNHARVAAEVCRKWKFPGAMAVAIGWHHEPSKSNGDLLANILHMADHMATMIGIGYD
ncbi:MAG TPA: HDOD domain-containing protein, partial [Desulfobacterales bacterium]|nr:HDOD domain-containing protein [Desulfobacterales bacterium]